MLSPEVTEFAQTLWDYHKIEQVPEKADLILGLGSYDLRVANRCAELLLENRAPLIVFSGAQGNFTRGKWPKSEAEIFADRAVECGAAQEYILIEPNATNTGDNVRFTRELLAKSGIEVESVLLVSKPNMNRRGLATIQQWWPEVRVTCDSPDTHFLHSPAEGHTPEDIVHEIVGDLQRIVEYPKMGYQAEQEIPEEVNAAYKNLIAMGYTGHMLGN